METEERGKVSVQEAKQQEKLLRQRNVRFQHKYSIYNQGCDFFASDMFKYAHKYANRIKYASKFFYFETEQNAFMQLQSKLIKFDIIANIVSKLQYTVVHLWPEFNNI